MKLVYRRNINRTIDFLYYMSIVCFVCFDFISKTFLVQYIPSFAIKLLYYFCIFLLLAYKSVDLANTREIYLADAITFFLLVLLACISRHNATLHMALFVFFLLFAKKINSKSIIKITLRRIAYIIDVNYRFG